MLWFGSHRQYRSVSSECVLRRGGRHASKKKKGNCPQNIHIALPKSKMNQSGADHMRVCLPKWIGWIGVVYNPLPPAKKDRIVEWGQ